MATGSSVDALNLHQMVMFQPGIGMKNYKFIQNNPTIRTLTSHIAQLEENFIVSQQKLAKTKIIGQ